MSTSGRHSGVLASVVSILRDMVVLIMEYTSAPPLFVLGQFGEEFANGSIKGALLSSLLLLEANGVLGCL